jgi:hypothetical protein
MSDNPNVGHRYARARGVLALAGQDVLLVAALALLPLVSPHATLPAALFLAIPIVLGFGVATLHYPSRVELDDDGISFARYGRVHRFSWREIDRIHVRRFLMRDRVLVRISPSTALRGRYWILDSIEGFSELVQAIEARARSIP